MTKEHREGLQKAWTATQHLHLGVTNSLESARVSMARGRVGDSLRELREAADQLKDAIVCLGLVEEKWEAFKLHSGDDDE